MTWLIDLFHANSTAHALIVLCLVAAFGLGLGSLRFRGIGFGTAGVLFSGLIFGHFGVTIDEKVMEFVREFGLILFVYTIGMQVGPGFLAAFKSQGVTLNLLAFSIVLLGVLMTLAVVVFGGIPMEVGVGLFSGGTTNTPSLAAARQALGDVVGATSAQLKLPGLGYAVAYPFGIIGIILSMLLIRKLFKVDPKAEAKAFMDQQRRRVEAVINMNIEITNPNLAGLTIKEIPMIEAMQIVVSRIYHKESLELANPDTQLSLGDIIHAVGPEEKLKQFQIIVGKPATLDLKAMPSALIGRRIVVTKRTVVGKPLNDLQLMEGHNVTITRVTRGDVQLTVPSGDFVLQFGDILQVVGTEESLKAVGKILGDSIQELNFPQVIPIFVGIALGVVLGSWPVELPGIPAPIKLGLAGGPLLVALILSQVGNIGSLIWYLHPSSNFILRELGIVLFLACVGLHGGDSFVETLVQGDGFYWMAMASLITLVPLLIVGLYARIKLKLNYTVICGLLAGSMTDPPALAFANAMVKSDAASFPYATVYPVVMILRIVSAQLLVLLFLG